MVVGSIPASGSILSYYRVNLNEVVQIRQRREERAAEESLLEQQRSEREREIMEDEYRDWLAKEEMFDIVLFHCKICLPKIFRVRVWSLGFTVLVVSVASGIAMFAPYQD